MAKKLTDRLERLVDEIEEIRTYLTDDESLKHAINAFFDEVERPVGKVTFTVPNTPAAQRAISDLFAAVDRNI